MSRWKSVCLFLPEIGLLIVLGREAGLFLEKRAKVRSVGKMEQVGDFLDAFLRILQIEDGLLGDGLKHELLHGEARELLHDGGKILGREAELLGIKLHAALAHVMLLNEVQQLHVDLGLRVTRSGLVGREVRIDVAQTIGERQQKQRLFVVGKLAARAAGEGREQGNVVGDFCLLACVPNAAVHGVLDLVEAHAEDGGAQNVANVVGAVEHQRIEAFRIALGDVEAAAFGEKHRLLGLGVMFLTITHKTEGAAVAHNDAEVLQKQVAVEGGRKVVLLAVERADHVGCMKSLVEVGESLFLGHVERMFVEVELTSGAGSPVWYRARCRAWAIGQAIRGHCRPGSRRPSSRPSP